MNKMVEVFITNVQSKKQVDQLLSILLQKHPAFKINFDLDDCDRILRVEGRKIQPAKIIELMNTHGYQCNILV